MIDNVALSNGNMDPATQERAKSFCATFEKLLLEETKARGVPRRFVPALSPCKLIFALDRDNFHMIFTHHEAGSIPTQNWLDLRKMEPAPAGAIEFLALELGLKNPMHFHAEMSIFEGSNEQHLQCAGVAAKEYLDAVVDRLGRPQAIAGFEGLQPNLDQFSEDHPDYNKNVFVAMRFQASEQYVEIERSLRMALRRYGLIAHRADDKVYPIDADLWDNICVYMMSCRYAGLRIRGY